MARALGDRRPRRAKIICTLGPSTDDEATLEQLLAAGMDACRLNLSFGDPSEHVTRIERVRRVAEATDRPVAIIADIPGRKVRLGDLEGGGVDLETDGPVTFYEDDGTPGDLHRLPVPPEFFHDNMIRGDTVLLSDGLVELEITAKRDREADARVIYGGRVSQETGVHVPGMLVRGGPITDDDLPHLRMAVEQDVDYIALTYVTDATDILLVKEKLEELGKGIPIIAKIERSEAFARLDGILGRADAIMVRRGDLGAQIEVTRVPEVQKQILHLAAHRGVPVIIATQMLGSMIDAPTPTRAEASDVSNAVADGADGVLLSAETAIGRYPVQSVSMMSRIVRETETEKFERGPRIWTESAEAPFADTTARIACQAAVQTQARLIACFTESGRTAQLVAKYRPDVPILAFCSSAATRRRLAVVWGVETGELASAKEVEQMVLAVEQHLLEHNEGRRGDRVVIVFGAPVGRMGATNSVRMHELGTTLHTGA